ncbi:MAG: VOC family protein, partial [Olsenella profusa]
MEQQDGPVELFDMHISHVGINAASKEEAEEIVALLSVLIGLRRSVTAPVSVFAGTLVEVMLPEAARGEKGHIGFYVNDIPAAIEWFAQR